MDSFLYRILVANWGMTVFNMYLHLRQWNSIVRASSEPSEIRINEMSNHAFSIIKEIALDELETLLTSDVVEVIIKTTKLCFYCPSWIWLWVTTYFENPYIQTSVYVVSEKLLYDIIMFPFLFYYMDSGYNDEPFMLPYITKSIMSCNALGLFTYYWTLILDLSGSKFFLLQSLINFVATFVLSPLLFEVILPLNNNYIRIIGGTLKDQIEDMAKEIEFPLDNIYIYKGSSKISDHGLAFYTGKFISHCIVINIKSVATYTEDEILAVVAHSLGHWKLGHPLSLQIYHLIKYLGFWYILGHYYDNPEIFEAFKMFPPNSTLSIILIRDYLLPPLNTLFTILCNYRSHATEFEADQFVKENGKAEHLKSALIKSYIINVAFPDSDPYFAICCNNHPSIVQRVKALNL